MTPKSTQHIIRGMRQDTSNSKASKEFAFHNHNIRITAREDHTLLSITNEKMPGYINDTQGNYIGHCVLGDYLVLFIHHPNNGDRIDIAHKDELDTFTTIYEGNLNFSIDNPIEALGVYENEDIQKVYWVDGLNQPRVINIKTKEEVRKKWNDKYFDFVQELKLQESLEIEVINGSSSFHSGVIQYAFTYFNKYGQESNIFNTTQLCYLANSNRGASPEEIIQDQVIKIKINNPDTSFDFLRIYSIHRTSINAIPVVKKIKDVHLKEIESSQDIKTVITTDDGSIGEIIDPTILLYMGGESIIPKNICIKDNTLFLGNIHLKNDNLVDDRSIEYFSIEDTIKRVSLDKDNYILNNRLSNFSYLYPGECYRLGIQFQYRTGKWSNPYFIKDYIIPSMDDGDPRVANLNNDVLSLPRTLIYINDGEYKEYLIKNNIARYRIVAVFPEEEHRAVLDSGIVCPTLYNLKNRNLNYPYSQSSWFFRPCITNSEGGLESVIDSINYNNNNRNAKIEFRDSNPLFTGSNNGSEVQNNIDFYVDYSVVTYHSPYIEFTDKIINLKNIKARIIGEVIFDDSYGIIDITSTAPLSINSKGFLREESRIQSKNNTGLISGFFYEDVKNYKEKDTTNIVKYLIYPWQKSGSLNFDTSSISSGYSSIQSAVLKNKKISNFRVSNKLHFETRPINLGLRDIQKVNNKEVKIQIDDKNYKYYFGDYNDLLLDINKEYNVYYKDTTGIHTTEHSYLEGVYMKYKSTPHCVLSIDNTSTFPFFDKVTYLGEEYKSKPLYFSFSAGHSFTTKKEQMSRANIGDICSFYKDVGMHDVYVKIKNDYNYSSISNNTGITEALESDWEKYDQENIKILYTTTNSPSFIYRESDNWVTISSDDCTIIKAFSEISRKKDTSFLYLVELYRDINTDLIFGGNTKESIQNNVWIPVSKVVSLEETAECEYGDTRLQRYDCLKTYAYSPEDENQIVEIASFLCSTRVNLLGRYDKNIGNIHNLNADPTNFNLFNPVYSQKDNFFNYRILDSDMYKLNNFPNTITWSKEKHAGEDVDTWTNITMASTLDLDGNKGEIRKLVVHNNRILAFQEKGIAEVLFNSRVQIPTSDGVPIEITNGYKVEGFRYISDGIGSKNKNSITVTPSGVYFLDSNSNSIYLLTEGLTNLSTEKGFEIWTKDVANEPSFKTFYDNANKDVYFTTKDECLGYSEKLGEFTSFYDYYNSDSMFNIGNSFYRLYYDSTLCLDKMFAWDYTNNYSIEFITNENPYTDKVFSHIEYRADMFNMSDETYVPDYSFGEIKVSNEYQSPKEEDLNFKHYGKSNLKKKFRMWRAEIPRMGKDRMRNPWLKIKLSSRKDIENHRMELHDIIVHYFE